MAIHGYTHITAFLDSNQQLEHAVNISTPKEEALMPGALLP
jgi:hypothetical protein